jgi:phosphopantetheinyl transferase
VWQRRVSGHLPQAARHASVLDAAEHARLAAFRTAADQDRYLVAVAVAAVPVGVDVEEVPPPHIAAATAPTALHPGELGELAALPEAARPAAFARCWTRKEAYLKGTGTGLNRPPAKVRAGAGPRPARIPGRRVADVPTPPGYVAAATYEEHEETDELHGEGSG